MSGEEEIYRSDVKFFIYPFPIKYVGRKYLDGFGCFVKSMLKKKERISNRSKKMYKGFTDKE